MSKAKTVAALLLLGLASACGQTAEKPANAPSTSADETHGEDSAGKGTGMATGVDAPPDTNKAEPATK